ncbi:MAG: hypothetical protein ACYDC6_12415 [Acidobacteriaceae bacterium]
MRANRRDVSRVVLQDCLGNFLHKISHAEGSGMVHAGTALAIRDFRYGRNAVAAYRVTEQARSSTAESSMPAITASEMHANVLRSRTARLPEWDTQGRDSKHAREIAKDPRIPPEDFIELAQNKIRMWTRVPLTNPQHVAWGAARA